MSNRLLVTEPNGPPTAQYKELQPSNTLPYAAGVSIITILKPDTAMCKDFYTTMCDSAQQFV